MGLLQHFSVQRNHLQAINTKHVHNCRSQWPRGLRRRSTAARLLWSGFESDRGTDVCVLSVRCLCDELTTRPEESYRLWCVVVCDHETSWYEEAIARVGLQSQRSKRHIQNYLEDYNEYITPIYNATYISRSTFSVKYNSSFSNRHIIHRV
jgi:hypothetical protein